MSPYVRNRSESTASSFRRPYCPLARLVLCCHSARCLCQRVAYSLPLYFRLRCSRRKLPAARVAHPPDYTTSPNELEQQGASILRCLVRRGGVPRFRGGLTRVSLVVKGRPSTVTLRGDPGAHNTQFTSRVRLYLTGR